MSGHRYYVILNASAGTANATGVGPQMLAELFERNGLDAVVDTDMQAPLDERIARALRSDADIVVSGGGDGTTAALAAALVRTDKALAILPLGTVNAVARDIGMPLAIDQAVAALASAEVHKVDVGEVNGHLFIHMVVVGVVPGVAAGREHIRGKAGPGEVIGFLRFFLRRLERSRRMALLIKPEGEEAHVERASAIAVVCSEFKEGFGRMFARQNLDGGSLSLYVVKRLTILDIMRLSLRMFIGRWQQDDAIRVENVTSVSVQTRKRSVKVMLDGEIMTLQSPLIFSIRPLELGLVVPRTAQDVLVHEQETERQDA